MSGFKGDVNQTRTQIWQNRLFPPTRNYGCKKVKIPADRLRIASLMILIIVQFEPVIDMHIINFNNDSSSSCMWRNRAELKQFIKHSALIRRADAPVAEQQPISDCDLPVEEVSTNRNLVIVTHTCLPITHWITIVQRAGSYSDRPTDYSSSWIGVKACKKSVGRLDDQLSCSI